MPKETTETEVQQSSKPYWQKKTLNEEELLNDQKFQNDAYSFILQRLGESVLDKRERIDKILEWARFGESMNEMTLLADLRHVEKSTPENKALMGKMYEVYSRQEGVSDPLQKIWDYAEGFLTAPSTVVAPLVAGLSPLTKFGGVTAITKTAPHLSARVLAKEALARTVVKGTWGAVRKTAAYELPVGFGAGYMRGTALRASGAHEQTTGFGSFQDINPLDMASQYAVLNTLASGILSAPFGIWSRRSIVRGADRAAKGETAKITRAETGKKASLEYKNSLNSNERKTAEALREAVNVRRGQLPPIDPAAVARGEKVSTALGARPKIRAGLELQVYENITNATVEILMRAGVTKEDIATTRISTILLDALQRELPPPPTTKAERKPLLQLEPDLPAGPPVKEKGKLYVDDIVEIMERYQLSPQQIVDLMRAEFSFAGKLLQTGSKAKKAIVTALNNPHMSVRDVSALDTMAKEIEGYNVAAKGTRLEAASVDLPEETLQVMSWLSRAGIVPRQVGHLANNISKARLLLMVMQFATTLRNTANATGRLATFMSDNLFHGALTLDANRMLAGPRLLGTMLSPGEARWVQQIFSKDMPHEFGIMFRQAADIESAAGFGSSMVKIGRWLNVLNSASDNMFKSSIFFTELNTLLGPKKLREFIEQGRFNEIPRDILIEAMEEALFFTYQKSFKRGSTAWDTFGHTFIKAFNNPIGSTVIPFPRFIASAVEFGYKHAPLIGMADLPMLAVKRIMPLSKRFKLTEAEFAKLSKGEKARYNRNPESYDLIMKAKTFDTPKDKKYFGIDLANRLKRRRDAKKALPKRVAQQVTGATMLYGAIQLRAQQGPNARWWEYYDEKTDTYKNAWAFYGPFAPFMLMADIILRSSLTEDEEGKMYPIVWDEDAERKWTDVAKRPIIERFTKQGKATMIEFLKSVMGAQFKTGIGGEFINEFRDAINDTNFFRSAITGEKLSEEAEKRNWEELYSVAGKYVGKYIGSFAVPMGVWRDLKGDLSPKEYETLQSTQGINWFDTSIKNAFRSFPVGAKEGEDAEYSLAGITVSPQGIARFARQALPFLISEDVAKGVTAISPIIDPTLPLKDPTKFEPTLIERGMSFPRQLTGLAPPEQKNIIKKELSKQRIEQYTVFPTILGSPRLRSKLNTYYQTQIPYLINYIKSDTYKNIFREDKREALIRTTRALMGNKFFVLEKLLNQELSIAHQKNNKDEIKRLNSDKLGLLLAEFETINDEDRGKAVALFEKYEGRSPNMNNILDIQKITIHVRKIKLKKQHESRSVRQFHRRD